MSHRVVLQPAYVLHIKAYRDTSALVEMLTPEYGRVGVVARGIKSPTSRLRLVVQPFAPILVSWSGRNELPSLSGAEPQGRTLTLPADALACGLYMNELIMRLTHRAEPQIELFSTYDISLRSLSAEGQGMNSVNLQRVLRQFEIKLLQCLGYGLMLDHEAVSRKRVRSEGWYDYQLENGPVAIDSAYQETFGVKVTGKTLLVLAEDGLAGDAVDSTVYKEAKQLLRFVLDRYLGNKPLYSRQLLYRKTAAPQS